MSDYQIRMYRIPGHDITSNEVAKQLPRIGSVLKAKIEALTFYFEIIKERFGIVHRVVERIVGL